MIFTNNTTEPESFPNLVADLADLNDLTDLTECSDFADLAAVACWYQLQVTPALIFKRDRVKHQLHK